MIIPNTVSSAWIIPGLKDYSQCRVFSKTSIDYIIHIVCEYFSITKADLLKKDRHKDIVHARFCAYYLIRERCNVTLHMVGKSFNVHHATYLYGWNYVKDQLSLKQDNQYKHDILMLKSML